MFECSQRGPQLIFAWQFYWTVGMNIPGISQAFPRAVCRKRVSDVCGHHGSPGDCRAPLYWLDVWPEDGARRSSRSTASALKRWP